MHLYFPWNQFSTQPTTQCFKSIKVMLLEALLETPLQTMYCVLPLTNLTDFATLTSYNNVYFKIQFLIIILLDSISILKWPTFLQSIFCMTVLKLLYSQLNLIFDMKQTLPDQSGGNLDGPLQGINQLIFTQKIPFINALKYRINT